MREGEERDPVLERTIEMFRERGEITFSHIMRECSVPYSRAARVLRQMEEMGYAVGEEKRKDGACASFSKEWEEQMCGTGGEEDFRVNAPAKKCTEEEIGKLLADAPRKREEMTLSVGEYSAFGPGIVVYIDYGKDIAYKRETYRTGGACFLLSMDIPEFVRRLTEIVSSWEHEMINDKILDGMGYHVTVWKKGEGKVEYRGQNKFPKNYRAFSALLHALRENQQ